MWNISSSDHDLSQNIGLLINGAFDANNIQAYVRSRIKINSARLETNCLIHEASDTENGNFPSSMPPA